MRTKTEYENLIDMLVRAKISYRVEHNSHKTVWTVIVTKPETTLHFHFESKELSLMSIICKV